MQENSVEYYLNFYAKACRATRGFSIVLAVAGLLCGAMAFLLAPSLGGGVLLLAAVALYFFVFSLFQMLQYRKMRDSGIVVDESGMYLLGGSQDCFFADDEIFMKKVKVVLSYGAGGRRRAYAGVVLNNKWTIVDMETRIVEDDLLRTAPGKQFLLSAEDYALFMRQAEQRKWFREQESAPLADRVVPMRRWPSYLLGGIALVLFVLFFFVSKKRIAISVLIGAVGSASLGWSLHRRAKGKKEKK